MFSLSIEFIFVSITRIPHSCFFPLVSIKWALNRVQTSLSTSSLSLSLPLLTPFMAHSLVIPSPSFTLSIPPPLSLSFDTSLSLSSTLLNQLWFPSLWTSNSHHVHITFRIFLLSIFTSPPSLPLSSPYSPPSSHRSLSALLPFSSPPSLSTSSLFSLIHSILESVVRKKQKVFELRDSFPHLIPSLSLSLSFALL